MALPPWVRYFIALIIAALAIGLRFLLESFGPGVVPFAIFYPAIVVSAVIGGIGPGAVTLLISGLAVTYFWLPPHDAFSLKGLSLLNFLLFVVTAGCVLWAAHLLRASLWRSAADQATLRQKADELGQLTRELEIRIASEIAAREQALEQLHESRKLETIGQLAGGIAHDFNNLLTPIIGSLDILSQRMAGDPRAHRLARAGLEAAERARTLVSRLLAFGRRQLLIPQPVDLRHLVDGLSDLIRRSVGPTVRLITDLPADLPPVRVDPNQLELALLNLVVNARDAMPTGGSIAIVARAADGERDDVPPAYVRLSVVDTGTGMDAETLARATEPFFSRKPSGDGTGLGLSMVQGLAVQSGGKFALQSAPGEGTCAELWLPITAEVPETRAEPRPSEVPRGEPLSLLLVDDEAIVREGMAAMLREAGHHVVEEDSGRAALERIRAEGGFDAVIMDYLMPGMSGGALATRLRAEWPDLPLIISTGYAGTADDAPRDVPVLHKPIRQDQLLMKIDTVVRAAKAR